MKKIICLLTVLLLFTLHTAKIDAGFISHKNMIRIEKISSACVLPLLYVAIKSENGNLFCAMLGLNGINIMANMALGSGYAKDKKSFLRMIPSAIMLGSSVVTNSSDDKTVEKWCENIFIAGMLGTVIKEATDVYSLVVA